MMNILISNDDGIGAEGIEVLYKEFSEFARVIVVAPERERSTTGHSLTLHKPLRLQKVKKDFYYVSGGPADCIFLGLWKFFGKRKPDLILSGINRGANLGQDVFYSGTVSAAREGANFGIPSMAVSLSLDHHREGRPMHYRSAALVAKRVLFETLAGLGGSGKNYKLGFKNWPKGMLLNVNVPNKTLSKIKGVMAATQGHRVYGTEILSRVDARDREYYWIGGKYESYRTGDQSDCHRVAQGYASVTPLQLDTTMRDFFPFLTKLFYDKR